MKHAALGIVAALMTTTSALAHHSFGAMFDPSKAQRFEGVVTKVEWANPHVYFYVDVKDESGNVENWGFETGGPAGLIRRGWTRDALKIGDPVIIQGYLARSGARLADARQVQLADGRKIFAGTAGDGGPQEPF